MQLDRGMIEEGGKGGGGGRIQMEGGKGGEPYFINACERCPPCSFRGRTREREVVGFTPTTLY